MIIVAESTKAGVFEMIDISRTVILTQKELSDLTKTKEEIVIEKLKDTGKSIWEKLLENGLISITEEYDPTKNTYTVMVSIGPVVKRGTAP